MLRSMTLDTESQLFQLPLLKVTLLSTSLAKVVTYILRSVSLLTSVIHTALTMMVILHCMQPVKVVALKLLITSSLNKDVIHRLLTVKVDTWV